MTFKLPKRKKGKLKSDIGIQDFYSEYKREAEVKNRKVLPYNLYSKILTDFNKEVSYRITFKCETYKMPNRLGLLGVIKFHQNFNQSNKHKFAVDWKKSKEIGMIIYHEHSERYMWRWDKSHTRFKGKKYYAFRATKQNKLLITQAIRSNPKLDYYSKLSP